MKARRTLVLVAIGSALAVSGCGHVVRLDQAQFGPSAYVIECNDDAQCLRRMARVCPDGYEAFRPGVIGVSAVLAADAATEAYVRQPARGVGLDVPTPDRRYIRCVEGPGSTGE